MTKPNLDEVTKKALNELTLEEVDEPVLESIRKYIGTLKDVERERNMRREANYGYPHEILWYGIDAVAHVHLMQEARDIFEGKLSRDEFLKKYSFGFERRDQTFIAPQIFVPLEKIESDGIFIPPQAYWDNKRNRCNRKVWLFDGDYGNRVRRDGWIDKEYARQLIDRKLHLSDLENQELVEQGVRFGKDMWRTCVEGFEWYKEDREKRGMPQAQVITDLGRKLIAYYSALVFGLTNPNI